MNTNVYGKSFRFACSEANVQEKVNILSWEPFKKLYNIESCLMSRLARLDSVQSSLTSHSSWSSSLVCMPDWQGLAPMTLPSFEGSWESEYKLTSQCPDWKQVSTEINKVENFLSMEREI